ncbi:hypothetical protein IFM89_022431 [Coptis chinensis]|uniref:Glycosyltransferase n=1 Tax=Coptis chinensis TaxID=261450 RepID=A0A835I6B2_9MAGN|nr:hypothetical protein IFM89_022431 [Coptis chinensis]
MDLDGNGFLHIVMFPWLAFGHMMPFFELAVSLAKKGNQISFISTPKNIQRLPKIPSDLAHVLEFIELLLPQTENLPFGAEATSDVPWLEVDYLKKAFDGLESPFVTYLGTLSSPPDWVIHDFTHYWVPPIAAKLHVPCVFFCIFNASFMSYFGPTSVFLGGKYEGARANPEDFTVISKWIPFENNFAFRMFEILKMLKSVHVNVSGVTDGFRIASTVENCEVVAIRSCNEIESEYLSLLQDEIYQKPVIPIGLLPPPRVHSEDDKDEKWVQIKYWLDTHCEKSAVYVALGSEATLSQDEMTELALGLELSELPFFWVLRKPAGSTDFPEIPIGFEDRVKGRGFICKSWAEQHKILSHPSIGGFLTHCGWSSVIESLGCGCPLVLLPMINDQAIVARLLEWKKISFEIPRNESDGSFTRESVAESLRKLVVEKEGEFYRAKAKELKKIVGDTSRQEQYIDDFLRYLKEHKRIGNRP